jgi:hypothetical protein
MKEERDVQRIQAHDELMQMCEDMDEDGNNELTFAEIKHGFDHNDEFRETLAKMDIVADDLNIVWTILDSDKSGTVTAQEFVSQVYKMKSSDTQFMLAYIKYYVTDIKDKLKAGQDKMKDDLRSGQTELAEKLKAGQERLRLDLINGQQALSRKLRAGPEKVKSELQGVIDSDLKAAEKQLEGKAPASNHESKLPLVEEISLTDFDFDLKLDDPDPMQLEMLDSQIDTPLLGGAQTDAPTYAEAEMLAQLRSVWHQCHISIDDMCQRHANLNRLLSNQEKGLSAVIRRLSELPSRTVTI